jgi:predicted nucleic acid-binding protein
MKLLLDTNIIVDVLSRRDGYEASLKVLKCCEARRVDGWVSAVTITDVMYILRKYITSSNVRDALLTLLSVVRVADVLEIDIRAAFSCAMKDFEDAVQTACARRIGVDYIVTRNLKDFGASPVSVVSPTDVLKFLL